MENNYFTELYNIDVTEKTKEKNGLSYLPWAVAWAEVKKLHPDATYQVFENMEQRPWFDDGKSGWVKTGVTVNGVEHSETLAVMDYRNKPIPADQITSVDAGKSIQRCLTKTCGRHGLGLYIYEGEDMPEKAKKLKTEAEKEIELSLKKARTEIVELAKAKIQEGIAKDDVYSVISKYNEGRKNPNTLPDIEVCKTVKEIIENLKKEKK